MTAPGAASGTTSAARGGPDGGAITVGISVHDRMLNGSPARTRALLDEIASSGIDQVTLGDHVSFHDGSGFDGLISAAAVLAAHDTIPVLVGIYQLALRHPLVVSRQLATLAQISPGRVTLGVGVGGEDRREISNSGVDPRTRGRRLDESLDVLQRLATGEVVDHTGEFFTLDRARIVPAPTPAVPIVIGGKGEPAARRTARYGDGWLGMFCSARRYAETRQQILDIAASEGNRPTPQWFGLSVWCGFGPDAASARSILEDRLQSLYHLPGENFARVTAAGTPADVAAWLAPYVEAGVHDVTVIPAAASDDEAIAAVAEVRRRLNPP